jgi:hypothetical protein
MSYRGTALGTTHSAQEISGMGPVCVGNCRRLLDLDRHFDFPYLVEHFRSRRTAQYGLDALTFDCHH